MVRLNSVTFQAGSSESGVVFCPRLGRGALTFDRQRLDRENLFPPPQRIRGIDNHLQFRRRPVARTGSQDDQQDVRSELHGVELNAMRHKR